MKFFTLPLTKAHNKKAFHCGKNMLDNYLHKQAGQDIRRKLTACFVLHDDSATLIKGYYTLSTNSIPLHWVPPGLQKKLPRSYNAIPTTLLGRLAIDTRYQKQGLGKLLLIDALKRSYHVSLSIGSFAVVVDPLDASAVAFYQKYGFVALPDSGKLFLPMQTVGVLFSE